MSKDLLMEHVRTIVENVTVKIMLLVTNVVNVLANTMDFLIAKVCIQIQFQTEVLERGLNPHYKEL